MEATEKAKIEWDKSFLSLTEVLALLDNTDESNITQASIGPYEVASNNHLKIIVKSNMSTKTHFISVCTLLADDVKNLLAKTKSLKSDASKKKTVQQFFDKNVDLMFFNFKDNDADPTSSYEGKFVIGYYCNNIASAMKITAEISLA